MIKASAQQITANKTGDDAEEYSPLRAQAAAADTSRCQAVAVSTGEARRLIQSTPPRVAYIFCAVQY